MTALACECVRSICLSHFDDTLATLTCTGRRGAGAGKGAAAGVGRGAAAAVASRQARAAAATEALAATPAAAMRRRPAPCGFRGTMSGAQCHEVNRKTQFNIV